jgi:hypothetical protein
MRAILATLALAAAASATADDLPAARVMIGSALAKISTAHKATVQTTGWEKLNGRTIPTRVSTTAYHHEVDGTQRIYLEQLVYRDGLLIQRLAGDGTRLWSWDQQKLLYSSTSYQVEEGPGYSDTGQRLFKLAMRWSSPEADFGLRLLAQAMSVPGQIADPNKWNPWLPTSRVTVVGGTIDCRSTTPASSRLLYRLNNVGIQWHLNEAELWQQRPAKNGVDETFWRAKVYVGSIPPDTDCTFVPPAGSRPRAVERSGGF